MLTGKPGGVASLWPLSATIFIGMLRAKALNRPALRAPPAASSCPAPSGATMLAAESKLVLEKGAERDNSTRGDILHPPTLAFLEGWGVLRELLADGALPMTSIAVSHRDRGRLATFAIESEGQGPTSQSLAVPHDRIEAVMKACAAG